METRAHTSAKTRPQTGTSAHPRLGTCELPCTATDHCATKQKKERPSSLIPHTPNHGRTTTTAPAWDPRPPAWRSGYSPVGVNAATRALSAGGGCTSAAIGGAATVAGTMYATGNIGLDSTDYIAWTNNTQLDFYVNGANDMRLESDGDLHVEGDVVAFSTTIASDPRLKENVEQVTDAVAKVEQLTGYTFDYKHGGASAGVMSTDVAQVLPSAVTQTTLPLKTGDEETEYDVVAYDQLHALLIEAVKELSARVKELEKGANG